jgi:hypothetical protein
MDDACYLPGCNLKQREKVSAQNFDDQCAFPPDHRFFARGHKNHYFYRQITGQARIFAGVAPE